MSPETVAVIAAPTIFNLVTLPLTTPSSCSSTALKVPPPAEVIGPQVHPPKPLDIGTLLEFPDVFAES